MPPGSSRSTPLLKARRIAASLLKKGPRERLPNPPAARVLIADEGHDANWFRGGLPGAGSPPASGPGNAEKLLPDLKKTTYKQWHKAEIRAGAQKISTDSPPHKTAAISIAATVTWWLK